MRHIFLATLVGLFTSQIGIVCTTVYLHRTVTHKAVRMGPIVSWVFRLLTITMPPPRAPGSRTVEARSTSVGG